MNLSLWPNGALWLDAEPSGVEMNLALDEALLDVAHAGLLERPVVRTWMAASAAVVVGASSRVSQEVDIAACQRLGVPILRRPSGGLTVVLGPGCLMWSLACPHTLGSPSIDQVHRAVLDPLAAALTSAGRTVSRRGTSDLTVPAEDGGPEWKVAGNSLRVRRHALLYHGTLLDAFDLDLVGRLLRHPPREPDYRAGRPHGSFLANLDLGRLALESAVRTAFVATRTTRDWPAGRVEALVRERYADPAWTHRL
jgi:lipoate-protein ligase A